VEFLRETQWLWWVAGALVLGLVEVASLDLVFAMLTVAALTAAGLAYAGADVTVQVLAFSGTAALLLLVVRPVALRKLKPAGPAQRTNVAANVGRTAEVLAAVTDRSGQVKLAGEVWSARAADDAPPIEVGQIVEVVVIDGATAVVRPRTSPQQPEN
jgi:membrane protein implicated in regulation of membrane protease activity